MPVFRRDGKNILFVHTPKAGGSSVERLFNHSGYDVLYRDGSWGPKSPNHFRTSTPQHMDAETLTRLFRLDRFDLVFMIVRHPIDRFRSEYCMRNAGEPSTDAPSVEAWGTWALRRYMAEPGFMDNHFRPQVDFHLPGCEVYKLEAGMQTIVTDLSERHGVELEAEVPVAKTARESAGVDSSQVEISPTLAQLLRRVYASDFATFGYELVP